MIRPTDQDGWWEKDNCRRPGLSLWLASQSNDIVNDDDDEARLERDRDFAGGSGTFCLVQVWHLMATRVQRTRDEDLISAFENSRMEKVEVEERDVETWFRRRIEVLNLFDVDVYLCLH